MLLSNLKVVEAPTLDVFESTVSKWKIIYSIPLPNLPHSDSFYAGPVLQRTPPVIGARIIDKLILWALKWKKKKEEEENQKG